MESKSDSAEHLLQFDKAMSRGRMVRRLAQLPGGLQPKQQGDSVHPCGVLRTVRWLTYLPSSMQTNHLTQATLNERIRDQSSGSDHQAHTPPHFPTP